MSNLIPIDQAKAIDFAFDTTFRKTRLISNLDLFNSALDNLFKKPLESVSLPDLDVSETQVIIVRNRPFGIRDRHSHSINLDRMRANSWTHIKHSTPTLQGRVFLRRNLRRVQNSL
ncbi:kinetochore protein Mis19/Eic1 [Schizosaccharomyces osmophilus]|uniref:Kinetochore protein Mis19/Eic1 n=1 Tax=Schizosaccharomyces osmophilus TaxID=2545709 RepID=A0AAE9W6S0_9SCHI|nr:kinetochore protein Mis19/Eic1 [Schizosaccharomyces osmophilus]WBW70584.1 kinetochore protein Mis19/Eic1 [Schizosaccharomyces osmophilus]